MSKIPTNWKFTTAFPGTLGGDYIVSVLPPA